MPARQRDRRRLVAKRLPAQPPVIPGFTYLRLLGTGGFSDVFLYQQDLPRREVAVKVMLPERGDTNLLEMFATEADALARVSAHPSILTIYQASRAPDGRPYLVMEYCPSSYQKAFREYILPVGEVLEVGVRMAGALETVHRAGLVHRDVKPANILRTQASVPQLSDFGVATARYFRGDDQRVAMSIPWSAPEVVTEKVTGSTSADIWSLGATLYSLLAGKSPFEREGAGQNTPEKLVRRITRAKYTPIDREDVPVELETVLARAMSPDPQSRQSSARILGEQLQEVQRQLGLPVTELFISGDEGVDATLLNIARGSGDTVGAFEAAIPKQVAVAQTARVRRSESEPAANGRRDSHRATLSSRTALVLALAGGAALLAAVLIVVLGR